ncbi:hypothetical protein GTY38_06260 [Streptomyces sp. SID8369]|nr:hypothetical protein [Streptomyces sp. LaPpAH-199]MYW77714.1 hypothetical protein [Streptomyces sp. SID8369]
MTPGTDENTTIKRRERHTATPRNKRLYITYTDAELKVVTTAARRDGQMALGAWAGQKLMAVAQGTLIPVSRDAGDGLRELIRSRLHLQEAVAALHALTTPPAPFPAPAARPYAALPHTPRPAPPGPAGTALTQALDAIARVDEATLQIMRERRSRT